MGPDEERLRSELAALEEVLRDLPERAVFERASMEDRRDEVLRLLNFIDRPTTTRANMMLFFGGSPVVESFGIRAGFAGGALDAFQKLVGAISPTAEATDLLVTATAPGSFGFQLEEQAAPLLGATALAATLERTAQLVASLRKPAEERGEDEGPAKVQRALSHFLRVLSENGASVRFVAKTFRFELTQKEVDAAALELAFDDVSQETNEYVGIFGGEFQFGRRFEFRTDAGFDLHGKIARDLDPISLDVWHHKKCRAVVVTTTRTYPNRVARFHTLLSLGPV